MTGCDRCGHRKRDHALKGSDPENRLCAAPVLMGDKLRPCLCPNYIKPQR